MRNLIPEFILRQTKKEQLTGEMDAWVLNIDLRGFTSLTQALLEKSSAGAEVLTDVINAIFTPAIDTIERRCGFIAGFAGDAFTAIFSGDDANSAINSTLAIRDFFINNGDVATEFGTYQLSAKLGLAKGKVHWTIIQAEAQNTYWFKGEAIQKAIAAQERAEANTVAIESKILEQFAVKDVIAEKLDSTHSLLLHAELPDYTVCLKPSFLSAQAFVPQIISNLKSEGEFREVLSCFINLAEPEEQQIKSIIALSANYGGYFNKVDCTDKGWVALILFGAPIAYEKMVARAAEFALEALAIAPAQTRIGMSYGKAYAGFLGSVNRGEYTALGMAVNLAARYMMKAAWGEIWLDKKIKVEASNAFCYEDLGTLEFKGFPAAVATYRLLGKEQHQGSAIYTREFVGRESEMEMLKSSCDALWEGRFAGVTYIYGQAGQGKSRLVYELQAALKDKAQCHFLQTDSIHKTPLNPFAYWIRQKFTSIMTGERSERIADYRRLWLQFTEELSSIPGSENTIKELARVESVLAGLIGLEWEGSLFASLEPKYRPSVIGFAIKLLLEAYCLKGPVLMIIEDLHWLDKESEETIQILTRRASAIPFKLIITSRLNDDDSYPVVRLDSDIKLDSLNLCGLSHNQIKDLMGNMLGRDIAPDLVKYVQSVSQGNPFITEQLTSFLKETGQLELIDNVQHLNEQSGQLPAGVQALLVARLDRLEAELKRTVQTASILGREFAVSILREMLEILEERPAFLNEMIVQSQLHAGEQEHIWNELNEIRYIFSHSLLRDAAYSMQLSKQLKRLHQMAGVIMEKHYAEDKTKLRDIAEHFEKAGEWEKAVRYFDESGDYESEQFHFDVSIQCYEAALKLKVENLGELHIETAKSLAALGKAYHGKGINSKSLECYKQVLSLKTELFGEDSEETVDSMQELANAHHALAEWDIALELFTEVLRRRKVFYGERHLKIAECYRSLARVYTHRYPVDPAKAHEYCLMEHDLKMDLCKDDPFIVHQITSHLALTHCNIGEVDKGLEYYHKGLDMARALYGPKHPRVAHAISGLGYAYSLKGDLEKSHELGIESLNLIRETLGETHPELLIYYHNVAVGYYNKKLFDLAHDMWYMCLQSMTNAYGEYSPHVGGVYNQLGETMFEMSKYDQALAYHFQCLDILNREHEGFPSEVLSDFKISCLESISETYEKMGNPEKAAEYKAMAEQVIKRE